jgi:isovaleryl-CoA dehydrogenase
MIPNAPRSFNFDLGESAEMIRDSTREFAEAEVAPRAAAIDRDNLFPRDLWPKMGALGLHGITAPEEYGGLALGYLEHCVAIEEVSRASASVGLSYGAHSNLCINQLCRNGNDQQKRRYLPKLISGDHVGAQRRLGRRLDDDARRAPRRPFRHQWRENVDHQRPGRRYAGGLRQD